MAIDLIPGDLPCVYCDRMVAFPALVCDSNECQNKWQHHKEVEGLYKELKDLDNE